MKIRSLKRRRLAKAMRGDYIFEPSENPRVRVPLPHSTPKKRKKTVLDGLGRSGGTRTHGLQYPKLARYQLRYTSFFFWIFITLRIFCTLRRLSTDLAQKFVPKHYIISRDKSQCFFEVFSFFIRHFDFYKSLEFFVAIIDFL